MSVEACKAHDWVELEDGEGFACSACAAVTPECLECRRPAGGAHRLCERCLARERTVLDDIATTISEIPDGFAHLLGLQSASFDPTSTASADDPARLPFRLDATVDDWQLGVMGVRTSDGVLSVAREWAGTWASARGEELSAGVWSYLGSRLIWASNFPDESGWALYVVQIRILRHTVRRLAGVAPERTASMSDCLDCGGPLAHEWTADGLDDAVTCQVCRRSYTYAQHLQAIKAKMQTVPEFDPEALVAEPDARKMFPELASGTIRTWIARDRERVRRYEKAMGKYQRKVAQGLDEDLVEPERPWVRLPPRGKDRQGRTVYRVGDIAALARPGALARAFESAAQGA